MRPSLYEAILHLIVLTVMINLVTSRFRNENNSAYVGLGHLMVPYSLLCENCHLLSVWH